MPEFAEQPLVASPPSTSAGELEDPGRSREVVDRPDPRGLALELLRALTPVLPEPIAEVISSLVTEGRLVEALRRAEAAIAALRRPRAQLPLAEEAPLGPR